MLGSPGRIYVSGDVEIDTGRVEVRRGGIDCGLRPKTFHLLIYLVEHRHRLVPKEELFEQLWPDTAVSDTALAKCVADIRKALGEDSRDPRFIRTAARLGYQFIASVEELPVRSVTVEETTEARLEYLEEVEEDPVESRGRKQRPIQWAIVGATAAGLLIVAALWTGAKWHTLFPSAQANRVIAPEPEWWELAWWKLNEGSGSKISDSIHGLTAALPDGVSWTQGISGSALLFSGREVAVSGRNPGVLPAGERAWTLMAWMKTRKTNGDDSPIVGYDYATPEQAGFWLQFREGGTAAFEMPIHYYLLGKRRIDDDRWHQVTGVSEGPEGGRMRLFVDGAEDGVTTQPPYPQRPGKFAEWAIGTGTHAGTTFRGNIDDVRVFERALRADEIWSLYRCMSGTDDIDIEGRGSYYFAPIYGDHVEVLPRRPDDQSAGLRNIGKDYSGVMFVRQEPDCGLRSIHGADVGQDMNIEAELMVPPGPSGAVTDGGPYFRSRRANPGDGIVGGASAGFWVRLDSNGQVRVQRLNPTGVLGFSSRPRKFDQRVFHKLEVGVHGETLEVLLDGHPVSFDVGGVQTSIVRILPAWETASPNGHNGGSAGIAFSATHNRGHAGGQEARNIRIRPYPSQASVAGR